MKNILKSFDIQSDLREEVRIKKGQTHLEEDYDEVGHREVDEEKSHPGFDLLHTALPFDRFLFQIFQRILLYDVVINQEQDHLIESLHCKSKGRY